MNRRSNELTHSQIEMISKGTINELSFKECLQWFIEDCEIRNLRAYTIEYYQRELRNFYKTLKELGLPTAMQSIATDDLKAIISYMQVKGLKTVTINTRLRAIRAFFNFLEREKHILSQDNPVKRLKLLKDRNKIMETYTNTEISKLFKQPDIRTFTGVRDLTIMMFFLETGVRVNELTNIHVNHIDCGNNRVLIAYTKGYKQRYVPIQEKMKQQLMKYLKLRGELAIHYLWVNIDDEPLQRHTIQLMVRKYGERAGVKASCHKFRHTFARMSVECGANIFELQQILGHATLEQVKTYVNLFSDDVIKKHEKFSPIQNLSQS